MRGAVQQHLFSGSRRRRGSLLVAGLALAVVAAACGGDGTETDPADDDATVPSEGDEGAEAEAPVGAIRDVSEQGDPVRGGSITVGLEGETNSWLPGEMDVSPSTMNVLHAIYDPLVREGADGELRPYLAEAVEPNDDFSEWTVTLREGVLFHDGTPLDAAALGTIFEDFLRAPDSKLLSFSEEIVDELVVEDDLTVTYRLTEPDATFSGLLAGEAGMPFSPTAAAEAGEDAGSRPVGTGPFALESWERDNQLVVQRNPDYWQEDLPYLDEIVFRPIPDGSTRVSALAAGDVDAIQHRDVDAVLDLRELPNVDSYEHLGNVTFVNALNTAVPPFDDLRVRRAAAMAVDQDDLAEVTRGAELGTLPASQYFSPDSPFFSQDVHDAWISGDPDGAAEELQAYIEDPGRSDGETPGAPVSFTYECPPDPTLNQVAQLYQAQWQAVGFDVAIDAVEFAAHIEDARSGDFQVKCWQGGQDDGDPSAPLERAFGERGGTNITGFTHPTIEENLRALRTTTELDERRALVAEISATINENVPVTYAGQLIATMAVQDHVKNLDGWDFPDGSPGDTIDQGVAAWGYVWTTEGAG